MVGDHGARPAGCAHDADAAGPFDSPRRDRLSTSTWPAFLTIDAVADAGSWAGAGGWDQRRRDHLGIGLSAAMSDSIDPRDFNAGADQCSQPVLHLAHQFRITTA